MGTQAIIGAFVGACLVAVLAFMAHSRLAGPGERPGLVSMLAFVVGWLAILLALITGVFLAGVRAT
jgi:hypothetical protein